MASAGGAGGGVGRRGEERRGPGEGVGGEGPPGQTPCFLGRSRNSPACKGRRAACAGDAKLDTDLAGRGRARRRPIGEGRPVGPWTPRLLHLWSPDPSPRPDAFLCVDALNETG